MDSPTKVQIKRTYLADYEPPAFDIPQIELSFDLHPDKTSVHTSLTVRKRAANDDLPLFFNGKNLQLESISVNNQKLQSNNFKLDEDGIWIQVPDIEFQLDIRNTINPSENLALTGMYMSGDVLCTQCEAEGFRNITYFPDRPDILSRYSVSIRASKESFPVLLSNGELTEEGDCDGGCHYRTWVDPYPKPCYLFALVAGPLAVLEDKFTTQSGKNVKLEFYAAGNNLDKCTHAMNCLKRAMRWDEHAYGREYDLNRYMVVAVDHFNMGAMENKGLNIFNSKYVYAKPQSATDQDFNAIESVISHEYFHNWSGNRITLRDWFQLSLKEGFTIFRDQQFSADMGSPSVQRVKDVNLVKLHQFREDDGPTRHPVQPVSYLTIDNFYTITVYNKGAELIRMLHLLLGAQAFRAGTDAYFDKFDGTAATVEDFVSVMEQAGNLNLTQFRLWYKVAGTPKITVDRHYDPDSNSYQLTLTQIPPKNSNGIAKPMHIPIKCALLNPKGEKIPLKLSEDEPQAKTELILQLTKKTQTFSFNNVDSKPVPSLLRGFSAPVIIEDSAAESELGFIMSNDDDAYCRWDAGQRTFKKQVNKLIEQIQNKRKPEVDGAFFRTFGSVLEDAEDDPQFKALLLESPSDISIAQTMPIIDPIAIHHARKHLNREITRRFYDRLLELHHEMSGTTSLSPEDIGKRSLRNLCLGYLIQLDTEPVHQIAEDQFNNSSNMTELAAALGALVNSNSPFHNSALDSFFNQWKQDHGVIDKWFRVQATAPRDDTLTKVVKLSQHPAFSIHTPNRLFALVGAFCHGNPYCFHSLDGHGYDLLVEYVLKIDRLNPQGAAQLADAFSEVRRYDKNRQNMMRERIERIVAVKNLSNNVYEIAERILVAFDEDKS